MSQSIDLHANSPAEMPMDLLSVGFPPLELLVPIPPLSRP